MYLSFLYRETSQKDSPGGLLHTSPCPRGMVMQKKWVLAASLSDTPPLRQKQSMHPCIALSQLGQSGMPQPHHAARWCVLACSAPGTSVAKASRSLWIGGRQPSQ